MLTKDYTCRPDFIISLFCRPLVRVQTYKHEPDRVKLACRSSCSSWGCKFPVQSPCQIHYACPVGVSHQDFFRPKKLRFFFSFSGLRVLSLPVEGRGSAPFDGLGFRFIFAICCVGGMGAPPGLGPDGRPPGGRGRLGAC